MNVYFVSAGEVTTYDVIEPGVIEVPETGFLVDLVAAASCRAATYLFWLQYRRDIGDLTDQRWETKLIAKDVDRKRGVLDWDDPLWREKEHNMPVPGTLRP